MYTQVNSKIRFLFFLVATSARGLLGHENVVTNPYRVDGFGAQFQSIIFSAIYAELHNQKFIYTPIHAMEHNYDNDPDFINKKEWLINFIDNFELNHDIGIQKSGSINKYQDFFEQNVSVCANSYTLKKIKEVFRSNKNKKDYFDNDSLNIAIHIRRPNRHDCRLIGADVPDEIYQKILCYLRQMYSHQNPQFHIYSQGDLETFVDIYGASDVVFHVNETIEQTFPALVFADVLVTSLSSLSYTAGFLSDGQVFYLPFWHPPFPTWTIFETGWKNW